MQARLTDTNFVLRESPTNDVTFFSAVTALQLTDFVMSQLKQRTISPCHRRRQEQALRCSHCKQAVIARPSCCILKTLNLPDACRAHLAAKVRNTDQVTPNLKEGLQPRPKK